MDFFELIKSRKSMREFQDKPIEREKLDKILAAVILAPSAGNLQAFKIFLVRDQKKKQALAKAALGQSSVSQADAVLVFAACPQESAAKYSQRGEELYAVQDATIACAHAQLAVHALGLSTVWVGAFKEDQVKRSLNMEPGLRPIAMLPIGYGAEKSRGHEYKSLNELVVNV